MKENSSILVVLGLLFLSMYGFMYFRTKPRPGTFMTVSNSYSKYKLSMSYNPKHGPELARYIDECMAPEPVFDNSGRVDRHITLADGSRFFIKASPGTLVLTVNKRENSPQFIKKMQQITGKFKTLVQLGQP